MPIVDVTADGSKVQCCKEQYCIGTQNIRSMNQDKLDMVKQEMARVNIDILGISEFNSDDHYNYCGQESIRRNGVALIVNKRVWNAVLGCNLKNDRMMFVSKANIHYYSNPSLCPNQQCWRSWTVLRRPTRHSRTNTKKRCPPHHRGLECKSRKRYQE